MNTNTPAGLDDKDLEIYRVGKKARAIYNNGMRCDYLQLPYEIREVFQVELISQPKVCQCLCLKMGITNADEMEETYAACRYGAMNRIADLKDGKTMAEIPVCGITETCPGFDIVCKAPEGPGGSVSRREFQAMILIAKGKCDKEIADEMNISITTVRTNLARIHEKLHINNRIEIALLMYKQGAI
jgi:DNA-binding CsgD family transcriptional regulator